MAGFSDDFLEFLKKNYPDVFLRATASNVSDATVTSIMSRYAGRYEIWKEIPEWIKSQNNGRIPSEVLNGNITVKDYIEKESHKNEETVKQTNEALSFGVSLLALGYAAETVATLTENHTQREQLLAEAGGGRLSKEQFASWLESRRSDVEAIRNDYKTYQPEKYAMHLARKLSRAKKRYARMGDGSDREGLALEIKALEAEFLKTARRLNGRSSRQNMVDYLRGQSQQAAMRHMHPEVLQLLMGVMEKQKIRIEPVTSNRILTKMKSLFNHESLSGMLKMDYERMENKENLFRDAVQRDRKQDERIMKRVEDKAKKKEGITRTIRLKNSRRSRVTSA